MTSMAERIDATRREIERLKRLPPRTTRRRAGSGNPSRAALIARKERQLQILLDMAGAAQEPTTEEN